jgi:quercetin dioxygenase-like cupin family protein
LLSQQALALAVSTEGDEDMAYSYNEAPLPPMREDMRLTTEEMFDHLGPESFRKLTDDLYVRDTVAEKITGGMVGVKVFRARPEGPRGGIPWHWHELGLHMAYVTKGWAIYEFEGAGKVRIEEGTFMYQPPFNRHRELEQSDDFEVIEFAFPADFKTVIMLHEDPDADWTYTDITIGDGEATLDR